MNDVARVLVVEDEAELQQAMVSFLNLSGMQAEGVGTLAACRAWLERRECDVLVLDIGLPDGDGLSLAAALPAHCGLVIATARAGQEHRIAGRQAGADDYLVKPIHMPELAVVVSNLHERLHRVERAWLLDTVQWQLLAPSGEPVRLTHSEAQIARLVFQCPGEAVARRVMAQALGHDPELYDYRRLETLIRRLRAKVREQLGADLPLSTVHGTGYAFTAPCRATH